MRKACLCKVCGRLGNGPGDVHELRLLNRSIRWAPQGLRCEADPRRAEQRQRDMADFRWGTQLVGGDMCSGLVHPGYKRRRAMRRQGIWSRVDAEAPAPRGARQLFEH